MSVICFFLLAFPQETDSWGHMLLHPYLPIEWKPTNSPSPHPPKLTGSSQFWTSAYPRRSGLSTWKLRLSPLLPIQPLLRKTQQKSRLLKKLKITSRIFKCPSPTSGWFNKPGFLNLAWSGLLGQQRNLLLGYKKTQKQTQKQTNKKTPPIRRASEISQQVTTWHQAQRPEFDF